MQMQGIIKERVGDGCTAVVKDVISGKHGRRGLQDEVKGGRTVVNRERYMPAFMSACSRYLG